MRSCGAGGTCLTLPFLLFLAMLCMFVSSLLSPFRAMYAFRLSAFALWCFACLLYLPSFTRSCDAVLCVFPLILCPAAAFTCSFPRSLTVSTHHHSTRIPGLRLQGGERGAGPSTRRRRLRGTLSGEPVGLAARHSWWGHEKSVFFDVASVPTPCGRGRTPSRACEKSWPLRSCLGCAGRPGGSGTVLPTHVFRPKSGRRCSLSPNQAGFAERLRPRRPRATDLWADSLPCAHAPWRYVFRQ